MQDFVTTKFIIIQSLAHKMPMAFYRYGAVPVLCLLATATSSVVEVEVNVSKDFSYEISLHGQRWLKSSPVRAFLQGQEHASPIKSGTAKLQMNAIGTDDCGTVLYRPFKTKYQIGVGIFIMTEETEEQKMANQYNHCVRRSCNVQCWC